MKKKIGFKSWRVKFALICGVAIAGVNHYETAYAVEDSENVTNVQFLGINDFHGALSTTGSAYLENGQKFSNTGKAAMLASYLNKSEKEFLADGGENAKTFRVQAGDMIGASPANSGLLQDMPTIIALNRMGFEIGTLGNHEFDEGLAEFDRSSHVRWRAG